MKVFDMNKDDGRVDLSTVNTPKNSLSPARLITLRNNRKNYKRDSKGKFTSISGAGGLYLGRSIYWKRALPVIGIVALVGGFLVYRSFAQTRNGLGMQQSFVRSYSAIQGGKLVTKTNNVKAVKITNNTRITAKASQSETEESKAACINYLLSKNDRKRFRMSLSATYYNMSTGKRLATSSKTTKEYDISDAYHCVELTNAPTGVAYRTEFVAKLTMTEGSTSSIGVTGYVYSLFGLKNNNKAPVQKGKFGFTWTQDNIHIPRSSGAEIANIHMYGWGSLWPYSNDVSKTEADDGTIIGDKIKKAAASEQEVMITACCAPSTYNTTGKTWDLDNSRVKNDKEQQYANRVAELVEKHPEIKYVQVWNELKGYWSTDAWDAKSYTRFYNKVYSAVKAKRTSVLVAGGYVVFAAGNDNYNNQQFNGVTLDKRGVDAFHYWLKNADGFDAIALDAFVSPDDFPKIMTYVRSLNESKNKPLWWSEFYNRPTPDTPFSQAGNPYDVAKKITPSMKQGDIALYWAERKYTPDPDRVINPDWIPKPKVP